MFYFLLRHHIHWPLHPSSFYLLEHPLNSQVLLWWIVNKKFPLGFTCLYSLVIYMLSRLRCSMWWRRRSWLPIRLWPALVIQGGYSGDSPAAGPVATEEFPPRDSLRPPPWAGWAWASADDPDGAVCKRASWMDNTSSAKPTHMPRNSSSSRAQGRCAPQSIEPSKASSGCASDSNVNAVVQLACSATGRDDRHLYLCPSSKDRLLKTGRMRSAFSAAYVLNQSGLGTMPH